MPISTSYIFFPFFFWAGHVASFPFFFPFFFLFFPGIAFLFFVFSFFDFLSCGGHVALFFFSWDCGCDSCFVLFLVFIFILFF